MRTQKLLTVTDVPSSEIDLAIAGYGRSLASSGSTLTGACATRTALPSAATLGTVTEHDIALRLAPLVQSHDLFCQCRATTSTSAVEPVRVT